MTKKHGHEKGHAHCEHCLHACSHCDIAYCCDCNKEWGTCHLNHGPYWHYTYPYVTTPVYDGTTTIADTPTSNMDITPPTSSVSDCTHAHVN